MNLDKFTARAAAVCFFRVKARELGADSVGEAVAIFTGVNQELRATNPEKADILDERVQFWQNVELEIEDPDFNWSQEAADWVAQSRTDEGKNVLSLLEARYINVLAQKPS
jgi:uncharacterized lipoprotein